MDTARWIFNFLMLSVLHQLWCESSSLTPTPMSHVTAASDNTSFTPASLGSQTSQYRTSSVTTARQIPGQTDFSRTASPTESLAAQKANSNSSSMTPPTDRTDLCELLAIKSVCSTYASNKTTFFDGLLGQERTIRFIKDLLDQVFAILGSPESGTKRFCFEKVTEFVCLYVLRNCSKTYDTFQQSVKTRLCKESCDHLFLQQTVCESQFQSISGTLTISFSDGNVVVPKHVQGTDFQCNDLPTRLDSNSTCTDIILFEEKSIDQPRIPVVAPSTGTYKPTAVLTENSSNATIDRCAISSSPTPRADIVRTCGNEGTVPSGTPCYFPFTFRNVKYYDCTVVNERRPWCATEPGDVDNHNKYGFCDCSANLSQYFYTACQPYQVVHGVCDEYVKGKEVFVDLCYPQNIVTYITNSADAAWRKSLSDSPQWCVKQIVKAMCLYSFPPCNRTSYGVVQPARLCKDSCQQYLYGNCSSVYVLAFAAVESLQRSSSIYFLRPQHISVGFPTCDDKPTKEETNRSCLDYGVDLGFRAATELPTKGSQKSDVDISVVVSAVIGTVCCFTAIIAIFVVFIVRRKHRQRQSLATEIIELNEKFSSLAQSTSSSKMLTAENSLYKRHEPEVLPTLKEVLKSPSLFHTLHSVFSFEAEDVAVTFIPEIDHKKLEFVRDLDEGQFGQVLLASITEFEEFENDTLVAVKVLKKGNDDKTKSEFMKELCMMAQLQHENIVKLLAKCTKEEPSCMVFEFMERGALIDFLRNSQVGEETNLDALELEESSRSKQVLSLHDLRAIIRQVCQGLVYLAGRRFVHRDIAARNCLVGKYLEVKIADFGLSRDVYAGDYYRVGGKSFLPVRWLPPESIVYGYFTVKSDVWAFGVLVWEVYSLGQQPYYGSPNELVVEMICSGQTLSKPSEFCPDDMYELMSSCWSKETENRPEFGEILNKL